MSVAITVAAAVFGVLALAFAITKAFSAELEAEAANSRLDAMNDELGRMHDNYKFVLGWQMQHEPKPKRKAKGVRRGSPKPKKGGGR